MKPSSQAEPREEEMKMYLSELDKPSTPLQISCLKGCVLQTVHEMARDEARHGRGLEGLLKRYF